jgi:hypothetical protein
MGKFLRVATGRMLRGVRKEKKVADFSAALTTVAPAYLTTEANRDCGEWPIEAKVLSVALIDTCVYRAEEKISAITDTEFCIGISHGNTSKSSQIWNSDLARTCAVMRVFVQRVVELAN